MNTIGRLRVAGRFVRVTGIRIAGLTAVEELVLFTVKDNRGVSARPFPQLIQHKHFASIARSLELQNRVLHSINQETVHEQFPARTDVDHFDIAAGSDRPAVQRQNQTYRLRQ